MKNKFKIILVGYFVVALFTLNAQQKKPWIFRFQDKHSTKYIHKFLKHDTLIQTSQATIHLHYTKNSNKPYLLLLHGMGANGRTNWSSQINALSKQFNLLVPDLIYFGESTSQSTNFSVEFQAQQINEAIIKIGITEPVFVMGFSYGALTAALYNQLFLSTVKKLIIIDGPVKYFSTEKSDSLARLVGAANMSDVIVPTTVNDFYAMKKAVMSTNFPFTKTLIRKIITHFFLPVKDVRNQQIQYLANNQAYYQNLNYNLDKTETLLIWGEKDGVVPLIVGQSLHAAFPKTKLVTFAKAKHDAHFRESKKVNKLIAQFLLN